MGVNQNKALKTTLQFVICESNKSLKMFHCLLCEYRTDNQGHMRLHKANLHSLCDVCGYTSENKVKFHLHQQIHEKDKPYSMTFTNSDTLGSHELTHTGEKYPYICILCGNAFKTKMELTKHERVHKEDRPFFLCSQCDKTFRTAEGLRYHQKIHSEEAYARSMCDKRFAFPNRLKMHEMTHTEEKPFLQDLPHDCKLPCKPWSTTMSEEKSTTKVILAYACTKCEMSFEHADQLKIHEPTHTGVSYPYACSHCDKVFKTEMELTEHESVHPEDGFFLCPQCDGTFGSLEASRYHQIMTHTEEPEKPYSCNNCNMAFCDETKFKMHDCIMHKGKCPYKPRSIALSIPNVILAQACTKCEKRFEHADQLKSHEATHAGVSYPYACIKCDKVFMQRDHLLEHEHAKHTKKPFVCTFCPTSFGGEKALEKHVRTHTGEKPFACPICDNRFATKASLKKHKLAHRETKLYYGWKKSKDLE